MTMDFLWAILFLLFGLYHIFYMWYNKPEYIGEYIVDEDEGIIYLRLDGIERLDEAHNKKYIILKNSHR